MYYHYVQPVEKTDLESVVSSTFAHCLWPSPTAPELFAIDFQISARWHPVPSLAGRSAKTMTSGCC